MLTQEHLKSILDYNPDTGVFTWLKAGGQKRVGDVAGHTTVAGYVFIKIQKKVHLGHRLAWLYMTGNFPEHEVDHKNGERGDNAWKNLREATRTQNGQNRSINSNNTSGHKGVFFHKHAQAWRSQIKVNGKTIHLGQSKEKSVVIENYERAAAKYFGEFQRVA